MFVQGFRMIRVRETVRAIGVFDWEAILAMARRTGGRTHIVFAGNSGLSWPEARLGKVIFGRELSSQPRRRRSQDKKKKKALPGKAEPVSG